jgi:hypothetical protein
LSNLVLWKNITIHEGHVSNGILRKNFVFVVGIYNLKLLNHFWHQFQTTWYDIVMSRFAITSCCIYISIHSSFLCGLGWHFNLWLEWLINLMANVNMHI